VLLAKRAGTAAHRELPRKVSAAVCTGFLSVESQAKNGNLKRKRFLLLCPKTGLEELEIWRKWRNCGFL